jgi:serine/threonine-protein kinase HipA
MKDISPVKKLTVYRRLSQGDEILLGQLAQNKQGVFFQYDSDYLTQFHSISPFSLDFSNKLNSAPRHPHQGLQGVFADSLPDGWGLLLMDRVFRQQGIQPQQITAMDRLAYIGGSGIGALSYRPEVDWKAAEKEQWIELSLLGKQAMQLFDGEASTVLAALANAGGSGGARPKALIYLDPQQSDQISTLPQNNLQPWLIKFTSQNLLLAHEEGLCEAAYLTLAKSAGIQVPDWQLFTAPESSNAKAWLAMRRFDCTTNKNLTGRYHVHSLCGLLDADFRQPSLDYEDLIKASQVLCKSPAVGQQQFIRAMFNLFADNQDDHTKNWSFLMDDAGQWQLAPFYDVTFSPTPLNQHMMAYAGYGQQPTVEAIQKLAAQANFSNWKEAQRAIAKVVDTLPEWVGVAQHLNITPETIRLISRRLDELYQQNKKLLNSI